MFYFAIIILTLLVFGFAFGLYKVPTNPDKSGTAFIFALCLVFSIFALIAVVGKALNQVII